MRQVTVSTTTETAGVTAEPAIALRSYTRMTGTSLPRQLAISRRAGALAVIRGAGIGLSVGWTDVPQGATDLMPLVRKADERMYHDKGTR